MTDCGEPDVRVAALDHAVQSAQVVAVGERRLRLLQRVQDRLVELAHQHGDALARLPVQRLQQTAEARRGVHLAQYSVLVQMPEAFECVQSPPDQCPSTVVARYTTPP